MNLFGLYVPTTSVIHRLGPGWKYVILLGLTLPALAIAQPIPSLVALAAALLLLGVARLPLRAAWALPWGLWVVVAMLAVYQLISGRIDLALVVSVNLVTAVYASRVLTMTTPATALIDALVAGLRPLRFVGVNPELAGLAVAVMLRSIPVLLDSFTQVRQAARARGLERNLFAQVTPVVVRAVGHAQAIGQALAARGLGEAEA